MIYKKIKYPLGRFLSLIGLLILMPFLLLVGLLIKVDDRGPVIFKQIRVGANNNPFKIYKFRTMSINTPKETPTDQMVNTKNYVTRVGKVLRKTSIDELPQLVNVVKGEMALIGPRPSLFNQKELVELRTRNGSYKLRPGITGLAQVKGRDELDSKRKAKYDGQYFANISIALDIKILFATVINVFKSSDIIDK